MAQDVKNDIKKAIQVNTIPLIAIMTAVTTVLTMFVKIPTPTRGYLNLSDTMIFFSSYAFGPWVGGIIGGLGPALSDLISGYPQWAIFTFIIDGLQAVLVGLLVREFKPANVVIGSLVAGVWKVFGYFIAGGILSGFGPALGEIIGNSFQMVVGLIVGFALFSAVRKAYPPLGDSATSASRPASDTLLSCINKARGFTDERRFHGLYLYIFVHIVSVVAVFAAGAMG